MTTFDDRKDAYENKYAHDKEAEFKIIARRNKLFGLWAAEQMHLKAEAREDYAKEVVAADFEEPGDGDVVRKVKRDFDKAGLQMDEKEIQQELHKQHSIAREQFKND